MLRLHKLTYLAIIIFSSSIILFLANISKKNKRSDYETFLLSEYKNIPSYTDEELSEVPKPTHPDQAAIQNYFMTIDPNEKRVPTERLKLAYNKTSAIQKSSHFKSVSSDKLWQGIPSNMAGRTRSLMYDPNDANHTKVWAGTATGGLWYNNDITNANSPWQAVSDFWTSLAISSIVADPNNSQVFYVGTGEAQTALTIYRESSGVGAGIWKSEDGGSTWNQLPSTNDFKYVTNMAVNNEGGNSVIYAGVVSGFYKGSAHQSSPTDGLYRSTDGGLNWEQVLPNIIGSTVPYAPSDIKISSSGRIFVGTMRNLADDGGSTILFSDTGTTGTWTIFDDYEDIIKAHSTENIPGRVVLATAPSDPNRVYALLDAGFISSFDNLKRSTGKFILKSNDEGANWTEMNIPLTEDYYWASIGWHALCVVVHPSNADELFIGGLDCYKSANGASSWTKLSDWRAQSHQYIHGDIHNYLFNPSNSNQLLVCTDGGVFMTSNSTASIPAYAERNNSFNCLQFYSCAIDPRAGQSLYLGGLQDNGTVYYSNQPINNLNSISGGDGAYCFIDKTNPNTIITSVYHNIYYFHNTVNTYIGSNRTFYDYGTGIFINPADYDDNLNILYANATGFRNQYPNQLIKYVNTTSNVSEGANFITITQNVNVPFSHIKISPHTTNSTSLFAGTESGRLFKVQNANINPSSTEIGDQNFPLGNISSVAIGGSEDSLLVTFSNYGVSSIWQTYDGGTSWQEKEGNLPDMPIRWAIYHPKDAKRALIATEVGVWFTDELDQTNPEWIPVNDGLAKVRVDMLEIRESDYTVLAATHGRGLAITNFKVGINNPIERESNRIILSPNPSQGLFQLKFDAQDSGSAEIKIFDMQGKLVFKEYLGDINGLFSKDINLSSAPKGQYIIRFSYSNVVFTKNLMLI